MDGTILLVDSDLIDRADWQALLQFHGYKVHTAQNGKSALECFSAVQPDVVLINSTLDDIPSDEVRRQLKANPEIGGTPVVIVLSHLLESEQSQWRGEHRGLSASDPSTREEALEKIQSLLRFSQFHLFSENPHGTYDCPLCNKRFARAFSADSNC